MKIITNGRNIELTEAIKTNVQEKLGRLENHYDFIQEIHVILSEEKNPRIAANQLAEATVHVPGAVIRLEAASDNLYGSIDDLLAKIERSLRKHKTKLLNRGRKPGGPDSIRKEVLVSELEDELDEGELPESSDEEMAEDSQVEIIYVD